MLWFILIIGVIAIIWITKSKPETDTGSHAVQEIRRIEMPVDAHDAVVQFAKICNDTFNELMRFRGDTEGYFWSVALSLESRNVNSSVEFYMDFDFPMNGFHEEKCGFTLGSGFFFETNNEAT